MMLGDEGAAEAVAFIFVTVDLDTVFEGFFGRFDGADGSLYLGGGRDENLDEVNGAGADGIHAVEHETAGGGVNEVDDVVQLAAELMNVFAVEGRDEGLVQLGEDGMGNLVAFMLKGFDDLHLLGDGGVMREHFEQGIGPGVDVLGLLDEEAEETHFPRQESLQESVHGV